MNPERYSYVRGRNFKEYNFYSEGPKGRIRKIVRFRLIDAIGGSCYNLSFGDWNPKNNSLNDSSVTNNGDTEKVLVTVAAIVINFTKFFPDAMVFAEGRNLARTRRYQMAINKFWNEIEEIFYVYGRIDDAWELFKKNINYNAFLATRKEYLTLREQTESYMSSTLKNTDKKNIQYDDRFDVDLEDFSNDPFFIEKDERARKSLEKYGLPKELLEKKYGKDNH